MAVWLCGWPAGEYALAHAVFDRHRLVVVLALAAWTFGGLFVLGAIVWQLLGRETITLDAVALTRVREAARVRFTRVIERSQLRDVRAVPPDDETPARVVVDYGGRQFGHLGTELAETEAEEIAAALRSAI